MSSAVIVGFKRSPFTIARKGNLANVRPEDILSQVINDLVKSTNINKVISGRPIAPSEAIELIKSYNGNEGRIRLTGFISRFGSSYDADVVLTSTGKYKLDWGQDEQKKINLKEITQYFCFINF